MPDEGGDPAADEEVEDPEPGDPATLMGALTGGVDWDEVLRKGGGQARWFRGASYRKWPDDGVPRSSTRIRWGNPAETPE